MTDGNRPLEPGAKAWWTPPSIESPVPVVIVTKPTNPSAQWKVRSDVDGQETQVPRSELAPRT